MANSSAKVEYFSIFLVHQITMSKILNKKYVFSVCQSFLCPSIELPTWKFCPTWWRWDRMLSIWILPGLTLQAGFNSFWINSTTILQSRKKCPLKKVIEFHSKVILLEESLTSLFFHLILDLYTQHKTAESDTSSRNKEPFFKYYEMIIMLRAW